MTDQSQPNDHPLAALDHWRDLTAKLAANPAQIAQAFDDAQNALGWLYEQAEASGNEQAKAEIITAWSRHQQLRDIAVGYDAALAAGQTAVETIDAQRREALDELATLIDAIDSVDTYDPRLQDFAEAVAADAEEYVSEWMYDQVYDETAEHAEEVLYDRVYTALSAQGMSYSDATRLMDVLEGDTILNDEQREQLQALIDSLKGDEA